MIRTYVKSLIEGRIVRDAWLEAIIAQVCMLGLFAVVILASGPEKKIPLRAHVEPLSFTWTMDLGNIGLTDRSSQSLCESAVADRWPYVVGLQVNGVTLQRPADPAATRAACAIDTKREVALTYP